MEPVVQKVVYICNMYKEMEQLNLIKTMKTSTFLTIVLMYLEKNKN